MEIMEAIRSRRAVREYEATPLPVEHLKAIVEAATWAPSGFNKQPWKFVVIQNPELKARMAEAVRKKLEEVQGWPAARGKGDGINAMVRGATVFHEAPVAIAALTCEYSALIDEILVARGLSFEERFKIRSAPGIQSVAAAIQNMLLAATSLGYGTCYGTGCLIAREELERLLGIHPEWHLVAIVPVGKPRKPLQAPKRKPLADVLEFR